MPEYRRWYVPAGTLFFTLVTHHRRPLLDTGLARRCLREAFDKVRTDWPFALVAIVLLPDHLHTIHWNPKKHGHVANVRHWPWSSFHGFVGLGEYTLEWGAQDPTPGYNDPEWGE
jgi:REP element-mobilizing transposase RayT